MSIYAKHAETMRTAAWLCRPPEHERPAFAASIEALTLFDGVAEGRIGADELVTRVRDWAAEMERAA